MKSVLTWVGPALAGTARVALGLLWLNEGLFKFAAHFGAADILLVADSAQSNTRVPEFFKAFAGTALAGAPGLFGVLMPTLEVALGVALILGVFTLPAALGSAAALISYWMADQLIWQYPVMIGLTVVILTWHSAAAGLSVTELAVRRLSRTPRRRQILGGPLRAWL